MRLRSYVTSMRTCHQMSRRLHPSPHHRSFVTSSQEDDSPPPRHVVHALRDAHVAIPKLDILDPFGQANVKLDPEEDPNYHVPQSYFERPNASVFSIDEDDDRDQDDNLSLFFGEESSEPDDDADNTSSFDPWFGFKHDTDQVDAHGVPVWMKGYRLATRIADMTTTIEREKEKKTRVEVERHVRLDAQGRAYGTGRRKTSAARVWIRPIAAAASRCHVRINKQDMANFFDLAYHRDEVLKPFLITETLGHFDLVCTVKGGGVSGQAGAIRHGLARALEAFDPAFRPALKSAGYLTRDARMVEEKKSGQPKARKKKQWVKR